jgi:hypothetical protein
VAKAGKKHTTDERRARVARALGADLAKAAANSFAPSTLISREIADRAIATVRPSGSTTALPGPKKRPQVDRAIPVLRKLHPEGVPDKLGSKH